MNKASFSLDQYKFDKVSMDFSNGAPGEISLAFEPRGQFSQLDQSFHLYFKFIGSDTAENPIVTVECTGVFKFDNQIQFDEIPSYFYRNCIAILFPFVRSFVSTVTLQANIPPLLLPTMNLSSLEGPLKDNTIQI